MKNLIYYNYLGICRYYVYELVLALMYAQVKLEINVQNISQRAGRAN